MPNKDEVEPLVGKQTTVAHQSIKMAVIIFTFVLFIPVVVINFLPVEGLGLFQNSTGEIAAYYSLPVTPARWTLNIWKFIYAWQGLWLIYGLSTLCRYKGGKYLYTMPVFSITTYGAFSLSNVCNVAWLFAYNGKETAVALAVIVVQSLSLYVALFFACKRLYENLGSLTKSGLVLEVWLIRMLIQNGIAFYVAWVTVATATNIGLVITYKTGNDVDDIAVDPDVSGTVVLALVSIALVSWFVLDMCFLDKYTRYLFSPYITLTVASAGILDYTYDLDTAYGNSVFCVTLLSVAALFLVVRLVVLVWRHVKRPLLADEDVYKPIL